jgi:Protein of unknown function (DUF3634)
MPTTVPFGDRMFYQFGWLGQILVLAVGGWIIWTLIQPRLVFKIRIGKRGPRLAKGKVTPAFLVRVAEACRENDLSRGWVGGVPNGKRIALRFSHQFPPGLRQRLRNEWQWMS